MKHTAILLFLSIISQVDKTLGQVRCGAGFGDLTCDGGFTGYCCSSSGFCGTTDACKLYYCVSLLLNTIISHTLYLIPQIIYHIFHLIVVICNAIDCGTGCQNGCGGDRTPQATPPPTPPPTPSISTSCGGGNIGNGICANTSLCCSQYGYCDITAEHCGAGCNSGPCTAPTTPGPTPPVTPNPTRSPNTDPPPDIAGGDSRVIAYVGNWEQCPTAQQLDGYTHIVVAFAVSYTYNAAKNNCNAQCDIGTSVPLCTTQTGTQIADWQAMGIKVILSFGGAGMGGSWLGDPNNCWDNCFGREDTVSDALVALVESEGYDGIDLDYEYCYDVSGGRHSGGCTQTTSLYSADAIGLRVAQPNLKIR